MEIHIEDIIAENISLGRPLDHSFFETLKMQYENHVTAIHQYQQRWISLTNFDFIPDEERPSLLEIQGQYPQAIDCIYLKYKKQITTEIKACEWKNILNYLCLKEKISWNNSNPFVSFACIIWERPCRITLVHELLTTTPSDVPKFFIRFHQTEIIPICSFSEKKDDHSLRLLLQHEVAIKKSNILICGPTGSGKTSLLKSLTSSISTEEHIVTIEDTPELFLTHPRLTSLTAQSDQATFNHVTMENLCTYALRITPDRLILGEIRGKEIITLALMINTGHKGVLTTVHASSAVNALHRLATLFSLYQKDNSHFSLNNALKFLSQQFQIVIYMEDKCIKEIIKVIGAEEENVFYETVYKNSSVSF